MVNKGTALLYTFLLLWATFSTVPTMEMQGIKCDEIKLHKTPAFKYNGQSIYDITVCALWGL